MKLTASQAKIIEYMASDLTESDRLTGGGHLMSVPAVAGSGKSLSIIELARRCPDKRLLFLAQSRNVVDRARGTLPSNVTIRTIYGMAARHVGLTHHEKLQDSRPRTRLQVATVHEAFPSATGQEIGQALRILDRFYGSSGSFPEPKHIPWTPDPESDGHRKGIHPALVLARDIWFSQTNREQGTLPLTFDALIKLWTLSSAETVKAGDSGRSVTVTPLGEPDIVILEEAQESSEALINFIARQTHGVLMLGDPFQALRPGNPAIQNLRHPLHQRAETVFMGESWRFGPHVAGVLNALTHKAGSPHRDRITGLGSSRIFGAGLREHWFRSGIHHTYIAHRSASLFQVALDATRSGKAIGWVDGVLSYPVIQLRDLALLAQRHNPLLQAEGPVSIQTPGLKRCQSLDEARRLYERSNDSLGLDLCLFAELNNDDRLYATVTQWIRNDHQRQEALLRGDSPERDITLCTVARCKGHEFPRVAIADDTLEPELLSGWHVPRTQRRAINRLYTAISRTQYEVALPDALIEHLQQHEWPVALSAPEEASTEITIDSENHPYFGVQRHLLLEMSPKVRDKRKRIQPSQPERHVRESGQEVLKEKIMEGAEALAGKDIDTLRMELLGNRRRRIR